MGLNDYKGTALSLQSNFFSKISSAKSGLTQTQASFIMREKNEVK